MGHFCNVHRFGVGSSPEDAVINARERLESAVKEGSYDAVDYRYGFFVLRNGVTDYCYMSGMLVEFEKG